ncbi:WD40 repeat-like protein [Epithele typhae]|uniref:WD40 repeat-like protein n=1 Tax=Epithele typhae TaxID=378194 RepID=UPI0020078593|nr:WD40 repeat-like protein [Epithele typhae]KAH9946236.1 WD40 repeat-like protein [Epithele typhae]
MQPADTSTLLRSEAELELNLTRKAKSDRTKHLGWPIDTPGKALDLQLHGSVAWIAENTTVVRKLDLETGKTLQLFRGHTAPVTALTFVDRSPGSGDHRFLLSGSWDKTIKVWDTETKQLVSSTEAHSDFVKVLLVVPALSLLVSGGSDKIVRFWDVSDVGNGKPLQSVGSLTDHTRPVEALEARMLSENAVVLYTGDTMGIIKVWEVTLDKGTPPRWQSKLIDELKHHRTRVDAMQYGNGHLWTASTDETVHVVPHPAPENSAQTRPLPPIEHLTAVRAMLPLACSPLAEPYLLTGAGDIIYAYDVSSPDLPELLGQTDGHWHDVTALRLWVRKTEVEGEPGKTRVEPWVVSASLDGTLKRWKLSELLHPPPPKQEEIEAQPVSQMDDIDEDEERELAELMGED